MAKTPEKGGALLKPFRPGQPIRAEDLNRAVNEIFKTLCAGQGITFDKIGNKIVLNGAAARRVAPARGGMTIEVVTELPAIPEVPTIVWYQSGEEPSTTDQLWASGPGNTVWKPMMRLTALSGAPG